MSSESTKSAIHFYAGIGASKAESAASLKMQEIKDKEKADWRKRNAELNRRAGLDADEPLWA